MSEVTLTITDPIYINTEAGLANTDILLEVQPPFYIGIIDSDLAILGIATSAEINAGVSNAKSITPLGIAGSLYRKVYIQTLEPTAPVEGDLWIVKS